MKIYALLAVFALGMIVSGCQPIESDTPVPAVTEQSPATETPQPEQVFPEARLPMGLAISQDKGSQLGFFDLQGGLLGALALPGPGSRCIHVAGSASAGLESLTIIRVVAEVDEATVMVDGQEVLRLDGVLNGCTGITGEPVIALGMIDLAEAPGMLRSTIYLVTPDTLQSASPVFTMEGDYSGTPTPVSIEMESGVPVGIWYTMRQFGIGGDIIFDPTHDLYHLDLASGESRQYSLDETTIHRPVFSVDMDWLAYTWKSTMNVIDTRTGESYQFPYLPESERGGGEATFSTDNRYVAWKEAHGFRMSDTPDYYSVLRVAVLAEGPWYDFTETFFEQAAGYTIADMSPVVWLDAQTLLVSLVNDNGVSELWSLDMAGPASRLLAEGKFVGFIYP